MRFLRIFDRRMTIARVYGIPVRIDYRWFVVFALSVWLIATNLQSHIIAIGNVRLPPLDPATAWVLALITTAGWFLSIFGHELSHALMAQAEGIEIEEIVLHPFGGLARLKMQPQNPKAELRIAVAGPAASFLFALLAFIAARIAASGGYVGTVVVFFLIAAGNLLLALFNLFPGYPLDGGRVLRAILWKRTGNIKDATRMAGICGVLIAGVLIVFGIYIILSPSWKQLQPYFMGGWSILVGLFLLDTAWKVVKAAQDTRLATVADAMSAAITLDPRLTVSKFVDEVLPLHRQTSFPVAVNGRLQGILALEDLKSLPRGDWTRTIVQALMRPVGPELFVESNTTLESAQELMEHNKVGALGVINHRGELIGFLQRGKLKRVSRRKPKSRK